MLHLFPTAASSASLCCDRGSAHGILKSEELHIEKYELQSGLNMSHLLCDVEKNGRIVWINMFENNFLKCKNIQHFMCVCDVER